MHLPGQHPAREADLEMNRLGLGLHQLGGRFHVERKGEALILRGEDLILPTPRRDGVPMRRPREQVNAPGVRENVGHP